MTIERFTERQLGIFADRCRLLAERVAAGNLRLIDAADIAQSAAEISGLVDVVGDDQVQAIMSAAFVKGRAQ